MRPHADDTQSSISLPPAPADQQEILDGDGVACWSEPVWIDTYAPEEPDPYPMFLDRRVYQGSSGKVYPIPFTERISASKEPRLWQAVHLENTWVRLMILPELGGRIHVGYDKTNDYDFFYRNNVIKPALVGLAGPWISGGVEFNWPQHHRPGTYLPVETRIERGRDGTATVWQGDIDPLQRMRGTHGIRLRPDSSVIEVAVRLHNRTDEPQTFLWWANVAAHVHDDYQSFFPTDVRYVADHARRAITAFPRADRPYYGVDYGSLVADSRPDADRIDFYRNIPVPTSYMITDTEDHFFGGYDHRARAGFVHWADRSIAPGKKQWTWGDGAVGRAWDRLLTDTDGPYVELMAGVFTDNQPDFSYLAPGETRTFSQYWYPIQDIGPAHQATRDLAISLTHDARTGLAHVGAASAMVRPGVQLSLLHRNTVLWTATADLAPDSAFSASTPIRDAASGDGLTLVVQHEGSELISWTLPPETADSPEPWVATEPPQPGAISSSDELYLTGVHLQQNRHPTRSAAPYFQEVLRRDPDDSRACLALGAWHYRRGEYEEAEALYVRALGRLTVRNLNPASGEIHYRLGLLFERTGRPSDAAKHFGKAAWDRAWTLPAHLGLAREALRRAEPSEALSHARAAQQADPLNPAASQLALVALRRLGDGEGAERLLRRLLDDDPLDPVTRCLAGRTETVDPRTVLTVAAELHRIGETGRALKMTAHAFGPTLSTLGNQEPMRRYLRASWFEASGEPHAAAAERGAARTADTTYAFPSGLDEHDALRAALAADPADHVAGALLGSWLLDAGRTAEAYGVLARATGAGSTDPVAWRNAAVALINSGENAGGAVPYFERALELEPDPRLVFERALLGALLDEPLQQRVDQIEEHGSKVLERDDLTLHYVNLLVDTGRATGALDIMQRRTFQPFEGGEGQAIAAYDRASLAVARALMEQDPAAAVELIRGGIEAPVNLSEGRHPANSLAERYVALGDALDRVGETGAATDAWEQASLSSSPLAAGRPVGPCDFWRGVALLKLGRADEATRIWADLEARADLLEGRGAQVDYFATSLPELLLFTENPHTQQEASVRELRELAGYGRSLSAGNPLSAGKVYTP